MRVFKFFVVQYKLGLKRSQRTQKTMIKFVYSRVLGFLATVAPMTSCRSGLAFLRFYTRTSLCAPLCLGAGFLRQSILRASALGDAKGPMGDKARKSDAVNVAGIIPYHMHWGRANDWWLRKSRVRAIDHPKGRFETLHAAHV